MNPVANIKTVGCEASCDLVFDRTDISACHASLALAGDGLIAVIDNDSIHGTYLYRNDRWLRIKRITLCIGDRVRFADMEVPLSQLTAVFGTQSNARLEARHFAISDSANASRSISDISASAPTLNKPVRNPLTGKIEERGD